MADAKLFTVKLTAEERERLEAHRAAMGLRAQTDVVRYWIAQTPGAHAMKTVDDVRRDQSVPRPATKPFKSRLKGEWKAP